MADEPFLSRWSRRKEALRRGEAPPPEAPPTVPPPNAAVVTVQPGADAAAAERSPSRLAPPPPAPTPASAAPPAPTLEEARALTPQSDFRRFVSRDVDPTVRNTALKTLFRDPHFNVMDGLDTYIEDYGRPDPIPASMMAKLSQSVFLGLAPPEASPAVAGPVEGADAPDATPAGAPPTDAVDATVSALNAPADSPTAPEPEVPSDLSAQPVRADPGPLTGSPA